MVLRLSSSCAGGSKSGKPCERLTAPYLLEMRVMRRMTESVNVAVRLESSFMLVLSNIGVGQVYSYETGGICSKWIGKTLFKILENWGLHRVAFLAIIVEREAHRTRWV